MIGKTISHYRILEKLGEGGMGVVYKARDTHLDRFVAIKILPPEKVADPERKKRFVQEAKAASALNHPNIITIYDIDQQDGVDFIAMEYVAGKTLEHLIPRHGIRLNEALKAAVQMADALARAHAAGIIHRDLKPANIMVDEHGLVKVLDFGLAKLTETEPTGEGTTQTLRPDTDEGMIVGTVAYMSPEQAEGKKLDARSDIFSFGSVLYEMFTGRRAFQGDTKASTIAAILKEEPKPASQITEALPRELERIITRCLRKDRERRFQDMKDLKVELQELKEDSDSGALYTAGMTTPEVRRRLIWALVVAAVLVIAAFGVWFLRSKAGKLEPPLTPVNLTSYAGIEYGASFSSDGSQVAFAWNGPKEDNWDIYIKMIGTEPPMRLTINPADDTWPAWSPDGRRIAFLRTLPGGKLAVVLISPLGGPERVLTEVPFTSEGYPGSSSWSPDGRWLVTAGLRLVSTETGESISLTSPPTKSSPDSFPALSPDGHTVAFTRGLFFASDIYMLELGDNLKPKGEPRRLTSLKNSFGAAWTPNGRNIIFGVYDSAKGYNLWKILTSSGAEPEQLPFSPGEACCPAISRSGNRLAYQRWVLDYNIWRLALSGLGLAASPPAKFIASTRPDGSPQHSPDGKRIAFESLRNGPQGIWVSDADGSNFVEVFSRPDSTAGTPRWSPDGQRIAFDFNPEGNTDIYVIRATGGKPARLTADPADDYAPSWSRDGKWVYFTSIRTGWYETWKVPSEGGEDVKVTRNGGGTAFESPDGKSLFYMKADYSGSLWKMPVDGGQESQVLPSVIGRAYSLVNEGIYFIPEPGADGKFSIQFLNFATANLKMVAPISVSPGEGLSVSPDGHSILYTQVDQLGSDLMLVENFR